MGKWGCEPYIVALKNWVVPEKYLNCDVCDENDVHDEMGNTTNHCLSFSSHISYTSQTSQFNIKKCC